MRTTTLAAAASALAAAALLTGAGTAAADEPDEPAEMGTIRSLLLAPNVGEALGSIGYGSLGTASLMDLLGQLINTGSVVLSVDLPNSTGSYAPGSLGSYGPEASIGDVLTIPVASLGGAS
ncbi:hypothetical protein [Dietzia sp. B32]|uniref:hypothetical protein n=1 Tax=Dietzia sp. B32 TaxID=2915130 RepID=UPI0021AE0562|nr:hypothetical protein [Dietzia sp. B32]UVE94254.1 hypothetical protein L8M95_11925 [Dietzia sp. B32]